MDIKGMYDNELYKDIVEYYERTHDLDDAKYVALSYKELNEYEKAFNYYLKGAKSNHVYAQFSVALAFATGQGVKRDMQEAKRWLKSAASLGHGEAQHKLKELGEKWD